MFKSINLKTLLSTPEEWHSLLIGFFEVLCPWKPRIPCQPERIEGISGEYHYYSAGRGAGFIALLCVILLFSWFIKEVLL